MNVVWYTYDALHGRLIELAGSCLALYGRTANELTSSATTWKDIIHGDDRAVAAEAEAQALAGHASRVEYRVIRPDGTLRWVQAHVGPVLQDGRVIRLDGVNVDVTERRHSRKLAAALEQSAELVALIALDGQMRYINRTGRLLMGLDAEAEAPERLSSCLAAGETARLRDVIMPTLERAEQWKGDLAWQHHPSGGTMALSSTMFMVREEDTNRPLAIACLARDLTEERRAHAALHDSNERFESLASATNDAVWDWDLVTDHIWWNSGVSAMLGYKKEQVANTAAWWLDNVHPADRDALCRSIEQAFESDARRWAGEYRFRRVDGSYASVLDRGSILRNPEGKPLRMIGSMMDMTERRRAEADLRELTDKLENAIEGIARIDLQGRFVSMNQSYAGMLGSSAANFIGRCWYDLAADCDKAKAKAAMEQAIAGLKSDLELEFHATGEQIKFFQVVLLAAHEEGGATVGVHCFCKDVTDRHHAAAELRRAKEAAEAANQAKSQFLANISHEIRTPMNGIIGMTGLLLETGLDRQQREYLDMVRSSADSLLQVINDVLDFSKIEAGHVEMEALPFALRDSLGDIMKSMAVRADEKGLELACRVSPEVPDDLVGDAGRLRQIVVNLVGNAIKFTDVGEVIVDVTMDREAVHFCVRDSGIGIPAAKQRSIFQPFTQADSATTRRFGGTGLGLTISASLVALMGGRVWVESEEGQGSRFHFTATFGRATGTRRKDRHGPEYLRGLAVLVVDDSATHRSILTETLASWDMRGVAVGSGIEALAAMREAVKVGRPFAVTIIDAVMPGMDGLALAAEIKKDPALAGATIMMLTSIEQPQKAARCQELGVTAYLTKPIKPSGLLDAIVDAVGRGASARSDLRIKPTDTCEVAAVPRSRPMRILLAEDNAVNRRLAIGILEKRTRDITIAVNGREAVELFQRNAFDVIFMDVQMPEMGGFEATASIRDLERTTGGHITIVAMTAHALKGDRERCMAAGMDDYIAKPLDVHRLLKLMDEVPEQNLAAVNLEQALDRVGGDHALLRELAQLFLADSVSSAQALQRAIAAANADDACRAAHTIKGSAGVFGASSVNVIAARIEELARAGLWTDAGAACGDLQPHLERLRAALVPMTEQTA